MHTLFRHLDNAAEEDGDTTLTDDSELCHNPQKEVKQKMARNLFRDSYIVKLYCIHVIPLYGYVMLI